MNGCEIVKCKDWQNGACQFNGPCWHRSDSPAPSKDGELLADLVSLIRWNQHLPVSRIMKTSEFKDAEKAIAEANKQKRNSK